MKNYNNSNLNKARSLRKKMTEWERKLWYCFLSKYPIKFRKQVPIDEYIADFYCYEAKLIVEVDGNYHRSAKQYEYDISRTEYFNKIGIEVYRVLNKDIYENFAEICHQIDYLVKDRINEQR